MRWWTVIDIAALVAVLAWLLRLVTPIDQAVRLRNAFLIKRRRPDDLRWTPAVAPDDFTREHADAPDPIMGAVVDAGVLQLESDWERARAMVGMLARHWRGEGAIRADLATTLRGIVEGRGYCADYVRVYLAAAVAAGLFCRQWAFSFDGFGGHGHTFVEIFDRQHRRWAFVDVHNNVFAVLRGSETPLSALDLRDALLTRPEAVEFHQAGEGRLGFRHSDKLLDYYLRGVNEWYMWWGNDVISRESPGAFAFIGRLSGKLAHWVRSSVGSLPRIVPLESPANQRQIARMEMLRRRAVTAVVALAFLALLLCADLALSVSAVSHA